MRSHFSRAIHGGRLGLELVIAGTEDVAHSGFTSMKIRIPVFPLAVLCVLLWTACAQAMAEADYRPLDREARELQRQYLALGGALPPTRTSALLGVDPATPAMADQALSGAALPASSDARALWLARQWMHRGYLREAAALLARLNPADAAAAAERIVLQAEILARQGQPARRRDHACCRDPVIGAVGGVRALQRAAALAAANDRPSALATLETLGRMQTTDAETLSLRDRANIAAGFMYLGRTEQAAAKMAFDRVRVDSLFSAEALFGLGWVEFAQGNLSRALIPWLTLNERPVKEPAVREALLLLPYAQWRIGAYRDAVERYRAAIRFFDDEITLFDRVLEGWREGAALDAVQSFDSADGLAEYRIAGVYDTPYVRAVLTDGGFQTAYDTWRHLQALERQLAPRPGASALRQRAAQPVADHRAHPQHQALAALGGERERSAGYRARAHFELARLLDEMAAQGEAK